MACLRRTWLTLSTLEAGGQEAGARGGGGYKGGGRPHSQAQRVRGQLRYCLRSSYAVSGTDGA
eukprot:2015561-Rhodomonas_salina.1